MRQKINRLLLASVTLGIIALTLAPVSGSDVTQPSFLSPLLHFTGYFLLAGALMLEFHDTGKGRHEALAAAAVFGAAMELLQFHLPYRHFSLYDLAVNTLGASTVLLDHRLGFVTKTIRFEDRTIEKLVSGYDHF
ncbi:MAG: VanZ family protein [Candidatus Nanohaloarchaea archaeon]